MSGSRLRLLVCLLVVMALSAAGIAHAPGAVARSDGVAVATAMLGGCHGNGDAQLPKAPPAHQTFDCCLMLCSSIPAAAPLMLRPLAFVAAPYPRWRSGALVVRTVPPDPGPPRT